MELAELRSFVRTVQAGSFTRAALQLGSQKSHVSRSVARLERRLGVKLLERTTRSLRLTEIGREIFERAIGILSAIDETERVAQQLQGEPRGTLRLTCGVEFGMLAVSGWIDGYLTEHGDVSVEADFTGRVVDVVHDGFDLAIRLGSLTESRLAARRLGELTYGLFAAPAYLDRRGAPRTAAELAAHRLLVFTAGSHRSGWRLTDGSAEARVEEPARLRVNNSFAVLSAAVAGLGVAQLPWLVAAADAKAGRLLRVLPDWAPAPVPVHAVFPSNRYLTPKVRAFIDHALAHFPPEGG
jgi:LysR family transcriptional regulator, regulator for bpeEF and oprC